MPAMTMTKPIKVLLAGLLAAAVLVPGGTYVYIHFISSDAPAQLSLDTNADASAAGDPATTATVGSAALSASVSGTWKPTNASQLGYRVNEILFGQRKEAVGRTSRITGQLVIDGTTVTATDLTADMTSVTSDQARRDAQFQGRIMNTSAYPTASFKLTQPIQLGSVPTDATAVSAQATGLLTLHGTTKPVTFVLKAKRDGNTIAVNGTIPVTFADFGIPNPSFGPVSTDDHGVLEFLVVFAK
jgi:polyisoprenoid-binding protein YceI